MFYPHISKDKLELLQEQGRGGLPSELAEHFEG
jgi:hypothetical protein